MKRNFFLIFFFSLIALETTAQSFTDTWTTKDVFNTPESVIYDAVRDVLYVSNINGNPTDKDHNGFISIIDTDGSVKNLNWIEGMDAPKGMVLIGNMLYVTDINRVHAIDIEKNAVVNTVEVEGASFLNDMAVISDGRIIISDSDKNRLYVLSRNEVTIWSDDPLIEAPNGLAFDNNVLYVGTKNNLLTIDSQTMNIKVLIPDTGPIDGIIPLTSDTFLISDWSGKITLVTPSEKKILQNTTDQKIQAADLGYIPNEKLILIPTFFDNSLVAVKLE
ncbi:MAG: hypothetical protein WC341_17325 [Bacteroidales bacterium]|jgi:outer membrane protein assembly factor BamB